MVPGDKYTDGQDCFIYDLTEELWPVMRLMR